MPKSTKLKTDSLIFPSGRTVKDCRQDAKKLKKDALSQSVKLSTSKALDKVAEQNGMDCGWSRAVQVLKTRASLNIYPVVTVSSPNGVVISRNIENVKPPKNECDVIALIKKLDPPTFAKELLASLGTKRKLDVAILNEKHELYRTVEINAFEDSYAFHHGLYEKGFYPLKEDYIPNDLRSFHSVLAPDVVVHSNMPGMRNRPVDIKASLMMAMVLWLDYLDSDPPIDNNEDFNALRKNRPSWTFDMCAMYWKFSKDLTGKTMSETPDTNIELIVRYATYSALQKVHKLWAQREQASQYEGRILPPDTAF
ncbi:hypothetical protein DI392_08665 [Vibrio albus]|uniref:Uncharacterized protein n=1 Tax=Vibrio albus TaxID=2200953 RepID=A0A2U3B9S4_9VIBR|nr:hypothetical protein [Vibrio albus]PWI33531.1 hypothetical protein DI392_08665 [Vibrio albus]